MPLFYIRYLPKKISAYGKEKDMQFSNSQTKIKIQKEYGKKSSSSVSIFCGLDLEQNEERVTFSALGRTIQRERDKEMHKDRINDMAKIINARSCRLLRRKFLDLVIF